MTNDRRISIKLYKRPAGSFASGWLLPRLHQFNTQNS